MNSVAKKIFGGMLAVLFFVLFSRYAFDFADLIIACAKVSFLPAGYAAEKFVTMLIPLAMMLLPRKLLFPEKLEGLSYGAAALIIGAVFVGSGFLNFYNSETTMDFRYVDYPSYILAWPTKTLRADNDYDYDGGKIYFSGYMNFINSGFRDDVNIRVEENPDFYDSYRVEVKYRGLDGELYVGDYDESNGTHTRYISLWPLDYDYELSAEDYIYMYKYKEDFEYSDMIAVEKITIYTAYPDLIDIEGIDG